MDGSSPVSVTTDLQTDFDAHLQDFPFRTELSLGRLIDFWLDDLCDVSPACRAIGRTVREELTRAPELTGPIADPTVLGRHQDLVALLMGAIFPAALFDKEYGAALLPFQLRSFYRTPAFARLLMAPDGTVRGRVTLAPERVARLRLMRAYALVLQRHYGLTFELEYPLTFAATDPDTGLDRHFKFHLDPRFVEVVPTGPTPALPDEVRRRLARGLPEPELLRDVLPPSAFLLRGFTIFRAIDVTDQEVLSSLKHDLIDQASILSSAKFRGLQDKLRTLLRRPELRVGLAAIQGDRVLVLNYGADLAHACIFADSAHHRVSDFAGTVYARAVQSGEPVIVDDLATYPDRTPIEAQILANGTRALLVAPLHYQGRVTGTLELGSPTPGDLNIGHLPRLREVLPLFSMAVQRSTEELDHRVQAVIKEQCTAIHPVVEWRFREAALAFIEGRSGDRHDAPGPMGPIVFEGVYPLYALSDIRGSSTERLRATQADLRAQLGLARDVLQAAHEANALPALDELRYRIEQDIARIAHGVSSGDEVGVVAFLRAEAEPLFDHVAGFGPVVGERVAAYRRALDPQRSTVYAERRRLEESVARLNEAIASDIDLEEQAAQAMFPHYFAKQQTDGVDYQIYVGPSLVEDGRFDPLYLKNLRLWQLMVACGVALRARQLRDRLPVPLETTHLILAQHAPLSIRFRFDEKRFDVDGAYDMRYEVVKRRIDKALVRGTGERVTQPGRIAIVLTHPAEAAEYRRYLDYLRALGYVTGDVEELELEELQGVHGLRALRVTVDLASAPAERPITAAALRGAALV
jgi:hypothetical protein